MREKGYSRVATTSLLGNTSQHTDNSLTRVERRCRWLCFALTGLAAATSLAARVNALIRFQGSEAKHKPHRRLALYLGRTSARVYGVQHTGSCAVRNSSLEGAVPSEKAYKPARLADVTILSA